MPSFGIPLKPMKRPPAHLGNQNSERGSACKTKPAAQARRLTCGTELRLGEEEGGGGGERKTFLAGLAD